MKRLKQFFCKHDYKVDLQRNGTPQEDPFWRMMMAMAVGNSIATKTCKKCGRITTEILNVPEMYLKIIDTCDHALEQIRAIK